MHKLLLLIALTLMAFMFSACGKTSEKGDDTRAQSKVPWGRPANWEGQMPGFGGAGF